MKAKMFAGFALALSLLAPAISAPISFETGALLVEKRGDDGPAVILIPGLASGPWAWENTAARLASTHTLYLVTLPGFDGRAPQPGVTLESLQGDLLQLIESRHVQKPVIMGHSLGSTLSIAFATKHSAKIAGVVAIDGLPVFPGTENMPADRSQLANRTRAQMGSQSRDQFAAYQRTYMTQMGVLDASVALKLAELSIRSDVAAVADFGGQILALDLRPQLSNITVPVLAISPFNAPDFARMGLDENAKTEWYRRLFSGVKRLEVVSISPARHYVMFDQPQKFAEVIDDALARMTNAKQ